MSGCASKPRSGCTASAKSIRRWKACSTPTRFLIPSRQRLDPSCGCGNVRGGRQDAARLFAVGGNLCLERLDAVELSLRPQIGDQLNVEHLAVQIAGKIEEMDFHQGRSER